MDFIFCVLFLSCLFHTSNCLQEVRAKEGGAAMFYLPAYRQDCGSYTLFSPNNQIVLTVNDNTRANISAHEYQKRAIDQVLSNGTIQFTLHHVTEADTGTYEVKYDVRYRCPFCYYALSLVDASPRWLSWGHWSACSVTCGINGVRQRRRDCTKPGQCQGLEIDRERCQLESCDNAYWKDWSPWSVCSTTCGTGYSFRMRECSRADGTCSGDKEQQKVCKQKECPEAEWSDWSRWTSCSKTCDTGARTRRRQCQVLADDVTGGCIGEDRETETCNTVRCFDTEIPTISTVRQQSSYTWTAWSDWSMCRRPCGEETRKRVRQCRYGAGRSIPPEYCGNNITEEVSRCNNPPCNEKQERGAGRSDSSKGGKSAKDIGVTVPLSGIVGTVAVFLIIILLVIVVVLVTRLRKKNQRRRNDVNSAPGGNSPMHQDNGNKPAHVPKLSVVACRESSSHCYAEIDEEVYQKRNKKVSVVTLDNPYSELPKSASTSSCSPNADSNVTYMNAGNEKRVFIFGNQPSNDVLSPHSYQPESKSQDRYEDENYDGGYLTCTPDSSLDHPSRQPKRFVKPKK